jgi:hypothetical protein
MPRGQRKPSVALAQATDNDVNNVEKPDEETVKGTKAKPSNSTKRKSSKDDAASLANPSDAATISKELQPDTAKDEEVVTKPKRKKAAEPQRITEKDQLPKLWDDTLSQKTTGSYSTLSIY